MSDGTAWVMGDNRSGQLGIGSTNAAGNPVNRPARLQETPVTGIAPGGWHSLILKQDGSVWSTGDNRFGQLGDGTLNNTNQFEKIMATGAAAVAAGGWHSLILKADGSVWSMGNNEYGQLGDGTTNNASQPKQILSGGVVAIAAGWAHSAFLKADGSIWATGRNSNGQLGDGTTNDVYQPELIVSSNVTTVVSRGWHTLFIKSDHTLWGMGYNTYGQLGDGTFYNYVVTPPKQIPASNVVAVAAGEYHTIFVQTDGTLWSTGFNQYGQLGIGLGNGGASHNDDIATPRMVLATDVVAAAGGGDHTLFLTSDGTLWGMGIVGALGDGFTGYYYPGGNAVFGYWNSPEQVLPPPAPVLTLRQTLGTNWTVQASCRFGGTFCLRSASDLRQPLSSWTALATNSILIRSNNNFTITLTNLSTPAGQPRLFVLHHP
jgi:alpha-tubulin suppressor-like RCC1 family protein